MAKRVFIFILLTLSLDSYSTTWTPAYPYRQQIEGQNVIIEATPYAPYTGSPMIGLTKVFYNNKLLYSIDKYYRERIFTSDDGRFLAIVHTSNSADIASYTLFGIEKVDYTQPAIEIFKDGQPFKKFSLKDIIDTTMLSNNGRFFYWGYYTDFEAFEKVDWGCKYCKENFSKKELRECLNGNDSTSYCKKCVSDCDSVNILKCEENIYRNSIYVRDNNLSILTNQRTVVQLDFNNLEIKKIEFAKVVSNKEMFSPPKFIRKYKKVKLPDKFDYPKLTDGRTIEEGLADLLKLKTTELTNDTTGYSFYINLVINKSKNCTDVYVSVSKNGKGNWGNEKSPTKEIADNTKDWLLSQEYKTQVIPKGFGRYSFLCIFDLTK